MFHLLFGSGLSIGGTGIYCLLVTQVSFIYWWHRRPRLCPA